ncbi:MAG: hypothetical protein IH863_09135, partial [Chloroflexi bacterium]|nr:hypothetical protein [Chloroflexota bacterium]
MRVTSACLLALAALLFLRSGESARADDLFHVTTNVNYDARTEEGDVFVTWDVSAANNDPGVLFSSLTVPVLSGATEVSAQSADGTPLTTSIEPTEIELLDFLVVWFDENLFFGDTYDFSLSYVLPEVRQSGLLVTPFYIFVPLVAMGDEATVTVTTPVASPWTVSLEAAACELLDGVLTCSGSEDAYIAGLLEVSQPEATKLDSFDVPTGAGGSVAVSIEYFESEDAVAAHQREVIEETMSLIADAYGFPYQNATLITVTHSGRQSVLGYEGLAECREERCDILISPGTRDYTLVHELAHLWSDVFAARWLSEGFADWVTTQVVDRAPEGLLSGDLTPTSPARVPLQLDEWEDAEPLIGASDELIETTLAGYDYSLRFVRTLADELGAETLRDVNRTLAESGEPADSRRYMDVLEEASGRNLDSLFLVWVFPESSRALIEDRREARERYAEVAARLAAVGLSEEPLQPAWEAILDWRFAGAQSEMDAVEANVDRALELEDELRGLEGDADSLGLAVPESIAAAISGWDFETAADLMESARAALGAYGTARERLAEPRNLWERFGLLGDDPDGELAKARQAFEDGRFERVRDRSAAAVDMVNDAAWSAM